MTEFLVQNILRRRLNTLYPSDYIGDGRYVYIYMDIASPVVGSDAHTKNCKWKRLEEIERIVDSVSGIRNALIHFGQMAHSCRFSAAASRQAASITHAYVCTWDMLLLMASGAVTAACNGTALFHSTFAIAFFGSVSYFIFFSLSSLPYITTYHTNWNGARLPALLQCVCAACICNKVADIVSRALL